MSNNGDRLRSVVHDFAERNRWAGDMRHEAALARMYRGLWPDLISTHRLDGDCSWQRWGVDRVVIADHGRMFYIDEKKRTKDWGDFLCEVVVCDKYDRQRGPQGTRHKGWTLSPRKRCDYIAYVVVPRGYCRLLPFDQLRRTATTCLARWQRDDPGWPRIAKSERDGREWDTANVAVPWKVLAQDMWRVSLRAFAGSPDLPEPIVDGNQRTFTWPAADDDD